MTLNVGLFDQKFDGYISQMFNVACTGVPSTTGMSLATTDGTASGNQCFGTMRGNGDAESKGIELEINAVVTDNWTIGGIYTYTDAKYADAQLPCNDYDGDGVTDTNGTPMVQQGRYVSECSLNTPLGSLPKVSFTANTTFDFHLGSLPAYVRANSFTRSSSYFPQTGTIFSGYTTVNTTIGLRSPDAKWDFNVWVKNLFDEVNQDTDGGQWECWPVFTTPGYVGHGHDVLGELMLTACSTFEAHALRRVAGRLGARPRETPLRCASVSRRSADKRRPNKENQSVCMNPLLGVLFHWLGGASSASFYVPASRSRRSRRQPGPDRSGPACRSSAWSCSAASSPIRSGVRS